MAKAATIALKCGVVGAGGSGLPHARQLGARADTFAVNAAE